MISAVGRETLTPESLTPGFSGSGPGATDGMALIGLLVTDAGRRLRLFSGIGIGIFAAGIPLSTLLPKALGRPAVTRDVMFGLCVVLLVFSVAVHLYARRKEVSSRALVRTGLLYVVLAAAAMAGAETILYLDRLPEWAGVSGICIWIVLFPLIIPCLPRQALGTALASASMLPLFYFVQLALGGSSAPVEVLVRWWGPVYFCAGLSIAAAVSIHRIARALAAARSEVGHSGRYELVEPLSEGGMGQVWRARHVLLPHDVAVKLIRPVAEAGGSPATAEDLVKRFRLEAHAVALLRSPHTVRLYDYGVSDSGELFAVMEFLNGYDLKRLVEEHGVLPPARVLHVLDQVCLSLAEAHEKGLVHRDVKPANVMVCRLGAQSDFVKVLDFGLVGAMGHAPESLSGQEQRSTVAGTPGYIAPEVLRGETSDHRADLYAIGVVAYWLLTGTTLFPREDGGEELVRHLTEKPEAPAARLGRDLPEDLTEIVLRLLKKHPDDRPPTALALRRELRACADAGGWTEVDADRWWGERGAD
jgi:serine/threonine-protein kinase